VELNPLRRLLRGFGANVFGQITVVVVQLAGVPILLHAWGTPLYGEWLLLSAIPAYLSMTELGFSNSAGNDMTQQIGRGDRPKALAVFQSLAALILGMTGIGILLTIALVFGLPLDRWLNTAALSGFAARLIVLFLATEIFVRLAEGISHAGLRACGDYWLYVTLYYSVYFVQTATICIAALLGFGPVIGAGLSLAIRLVATPLVFLALKQRHPWIQYGFAHASYRELRRLTAPAMANLSWTLSQALNSQGMILVVGAELGPQAVVIFSTLRTLTRLTLQMVFTVAVAAEPEFAIAFGAQDHNLILRIFVHVMRAGLWLALTSAAGLALLGPWILRIWTHGKVPMNSALFGWLLLIAVTSVFWFTALTMLKAANRHIRATLLYCLVSGLAVAAGAVAIAMTKHLADVGIALLAADIVMAIYSVRAASQLIGVPAGDYLVQSLNPLPLFAVFVRRMGRYGG
jgi:O-antigen/teichoic acid export membrane protein